MERILVGDNYLRCVMTVTLIIYYKTFVTHFNKIKQTGIHRFYY